MANVTTVTAGTRILSCVRPKGKFPLGRTVEYLKRGRELKPGIETMAIYYRAVNPADYGTKQFVFYNLPQLVYANPDIQFNTFKSQRPHAAIDFYLTGGERIQVNVGEMTREEVVAVVLKIAEKSPEQIEADKKPKNLNPLDPRFRMNPANFGWPEFGQRNCICDLPGQLPCSRFWKKWPKHLRAYRSKIKGIGKGHKADIKYMDLDDI